jgi:hypothetical protein
VQGCFRAPGSHGRLPGDLAIVPRGQRGRSRAGVEEFHGGALTGGGMLCPKLGGQWQLGLAAR